MFEIIGYEFSWGKLRINVSDGRTLYVCLGYRVSDPVDSVELVEDSDTNVLLINDESYTVNGDSLSSVTSSYLLSENDIFTPQNTPDQKTLNSGQLNRIWVYDRNIYMPSDDVQCLISTKSGIYELRNFADVSPAKSIGAAPYGYDGDYAIVNAVGCCPVYGFLFVEAANCKYYLADEGFADAREIKLTGDIITPISIKFQNGLTKNYSVQVNGANIILLPEDCLFDKTLNIADIAQSEPPLMIWSTIGTYHICGKQKYINRLTNKILNLLPPTANERPFSY